MTVGFEAYNDSGVLQFAATDQDVYVFTEKGTSISDQSIIGVDGSARRAFEVPLTVMPVGSVCTALVAVRCTGGLVYAPWLEELPHSVFNPLLLPAENLDDSVDWYAFKKISDLTMPSSAAGMQIFNSDGSTAYHSNWKPMQPRVKTPVTTMSLAMSQFVDLPAGRTFAAMQYGTSLINLGYAFPHDYMAGSAGVRFASGDAYIEVLDSGALSTVDTFGAGGILFIDVTGY